MADRLTREQRSAHMARIRSRRTRPEMRVHGWLKGNRVRHKMWPDLPGRPDVFIREGRVCVFVNGCFWHGCRRHYREPKTNRAFWRAKIARNRQRQREVKRALEGLGFAVVVLWEHDLRGVDNSAIRGAAGYNRGNH